MANRVSPDIRKRHAFIGWIVGILIVLSACSSQSSATATPTASPKASPSASAANGDCAVKGQTPPSRNISANYATALAFAPDGRLFWAERSGTVKVWQDGGARTFATVKTVTTERGGGYSERGLLGLAISPTFNQDRFVYAFYSDSELHRAARHSLA